ncbi:hypothetical protein SDC9_64079 [bioreactor metagenome]|uniref:Uncharacterized protein n=1 Tax=bioreactor metagenome TaxID=1076179 RepID=A0A644XNB8_9ZZZZ
MNIEEYYLFLEWISTQKIKIGESLFHNFENLLHEGNAAAIEAINFRVQFIGKHEENIATSYFIMGHFTNYDKQKRIACICVGLEAEYIKGIMMSASLFCQLPFFVSFPYIKTPENLILYA